VSGFNLIYGIAAIANSHVWDPSVCRCLRSAMLTPRGPSLRLAHPHDDRGAGDADMPPSPDVASSRTRQSSLHNGSDLCGER